MNLQDVRRQAKALLDDIDTTRDRAIGLGMPDHEAGKIGADAEETARNSIALLDMIEDMNARSPAADPVLVLAVDIITRAPGVPVSMGDVVKLCDGLKHAFNKYKAREEAELSYPVEARAPGAETAKARAHAIRAILFASLSPDPGEDPERVDWDDLISYLRRDGVSDPGLDEVTAALRSMGARAEGPGWILDRLGVTIDFGDPDEPVKSTPVEDDAVRVETDGKQTTTPALGGDPALPVAKKGRAPETQKPLATWELSGSDFRALPFDRAWVESQLPAFRAEQGEGSAARPRVVFAAWLGKREGAGEHKRAEAT